MSMLKTIEVEFTTKKVLPVKLSSQATGPDALSAIQKWGEENSVTINIYRTQLAGVSTLFFCDLTQGAAPAVNAILKVLPSYVTKPDTGVVIHKQA